MAGPSSPAALRLEQGRREDFLPRGRACVYCRRRKMKCDAQKPVCGPCARSNRGDECEYADSQGFSTADYLEEDIGRIECRIYELEHPEEAENTTVFLYHPYKQPQQRSHIPSPAQILDFLDPPSPVLASATDAWWSSPEPPIAMVENLVDIFITCASDWGFFLDTSRFRRDALLTHPIGHHSRPSPALLTAVYLIGIALSDSPAWKAHEKTFLGRALSSLPASLAGIHPRKAIHGLQAEILISNYFYISGRYLEGRYHTAATVSLAVSTVLANPSAATIRDAAGRVEETERVDACWTTVILDMGWAVAMATYPNLQQSSETLLDLPFPDAGCTISQFLHGTEPRSASMSPKTLLAKAVILWERAYTLVVGWHPDMGLNQSDFSAEFTGVDSRIADLQAQISFSFMDNPALESASIRRRIIVGRSIVHAAVIQLHGTFVRTNMESKGKCLAAAQAILQLAVNADLLGSSFICPLFSNICAAASEVAIDEIGALRAVRLAWAHAPDTRRKRARTRFRICPQCYAVVHKLAVAEFSPLKN